MGLRTASGICQRDTNAISLMIFQIGINILNYLDYLAGAETKEKLILPISVWKLYCKNVVLKNLLKKQYIPPR